MRETDDIRIERPAAGTAVVVFRGEHDVSSSLELEELLASLIAENRLVVADLSRAEFVDSSIINSLVETKRAASERGRRFRVQMGTQAVVHRVCEVTRVLGLLACAATHGEALRNDRE